MQPVMAFRLRRGEPTEFHRGHPSAILQRNIQEVTPYRAERPERDLTMTKSYSVVEFAEAEGVSRATIYNLWTRGEGPRFYTVGNRRRITEEARQDWHRAREAVTGKAVR